MVTYGTQFDNPSTQQGEGSLTSELSSDHWTLCTDNVEWFKLYRNINI